MARTKNTPQAPAIDAEQYAQFLAFQAFLASQAAPASADTAPASPARKSRPASPARNTGAKASAARKPRKSAETPAKQGNSEWVVRESWAGAEASPRMLATAIRHKVETPAKLAKMDKLTMSCAIGASMGRTIRREP